MGANWLSRPGVSNMKVKICKFLVRNGRLVMSHTVLMKQDSFRKFASMFGGLVADSVSPECNEVLCHDRCTLFLAVNKKMSSLSQKTDANTLIEDLYVLNFFGCGETLCLHSLDCTLVSGPYIWIQVSSTVTRQFKNPIGSHPNRSKMACEAST
jgi:hypothetical protein